jgi:hypothetical protein
VFCDIIFLGNQQMMPRQQEAKKLEPNKYSKIYKVGGFHFRYNFTEALLECVWKDKDAEQYEVIDAQGLSVKNWTADPKDYLQVFANELQEEVGYLTDEFVN